MYTLDSLVCPNELSLDIPSSVSVNENSFNFEFFENFVSVPGNDETPKKKPKEDIPSEIKEPAKWYKRNMIQRIIEETESDESEEDDDEDEDYDPDEEYSETKNNESSLVMTTIQEELLSR